jgi:PucR C-terminal helix-turn-helix domain/GGDEF-like domain
MTPRPRSALAARRQRSAGAVEDLSARLRARRAEIEEAVLTRAFALAGSSTLDPAYADGLRATVSAAIDYALDAVELGAERSPPPPPPLLAQARLAARNGVPLDTVLRRYFAGHALIADFLVEEAERQGPLSHAKLQRLLRSQALVFDRLLAAVSEEHRRESQSHRASTEERRVQRIERLLAGELVDTAGLGYELEGSHHIGAVATGEGAPEALRELAGGIDCRLLIARRNEETVWAWLGGQRATDPAKVKDRAGDLLPPEASLAIGEPGKGLAGWRFTHQQALAALPIALRGAEAVVRYGDVAVLAAVLKEDILATTLIELYLQPLESKRDDGALVDTLRAYFSTGRHASSAAAVLGVNRSTVASRLSAIEGRLGRPLASCLAELELALCLAELERSSPAGDVHSKSAN